MQLRNFNGGLNTRLTPSKITDNQAIVCENVDFTANTIKPFPLKSSTSPFTETGDVFYRHKDIIHTDNFNGDIAPIFLESQRNLYRVHRNSTVGTGVLQRYIDGTWYSVALKGTVNTQALTHVTDPANANNLFLNLPLAEVEDVTSSRVNSVENLNIIYNPIHASEPSTASYDGITTGDLYLNNQDSLWTTETGTVYASWLNPWNAEFEGLESRGFDSSIIQLCKDFVYELMKVRENNQVRMKFVLDSSEKKTSYGFYEFEVITQSPLQVGEANDSGVFKKVDFTDTYNLTYYVNGTIDSNYSTTHPNLVDTADNFIGGDQITQEKHTYKYLITFYSSIADYESDSVLIDGEVLSYDWDFSRLDLDITTIDSSYFDNIRIYRLGFGATAYTQIAELPIALNGNTVVSFDDTDLTNAAYTGKIFDTLDNNGPPINITHAIDVNGRIILAADNRLYLDELGTSDSFPVLNQIEFNVDILAIAESQSGVLAYLDNNKTYLVLLVSEGRFAKRLYSGNQSCRAFASLQYLKGHPLWVSFDGFCTVGQSGIQVISKDKLDKLNIVCKASAVFDERYYALLDTGIIYVCDFRFNAIKFYTLQGNFNNVTSFLVLDDTLYIVDNQKLVKLFDSGLYSYTYKTGIIDQGSATIVKNYESLYIHKLDDEEVIITLFDSLGKQLLKNSYTEDRLIRLDIPARIQDLVGIQFMFEGTSEIAEVGFTAKGGANGQCC